MRARPPILALVGLVMLLPLGCDDAGTTPQADPAPERAPLEHERATPAPDPADTVPVAPVEAPTPPPVEALDLATVTEVRVRVLVAHRDSSWVPCGYVHSTGMIEVEVLGHGEPGPRMLLIISCPVDFGRGLLEVGAIRDVELYTKRQRWPTPAANRRLAAELPRRQVERVRVVAP